MRENLLVIWGKAGAGKTTFAVNLACALAQSDHTVGLLSSNLQHGELQVFFGQTIHETKGLLMALNDTGNASKYSWKCGYGNVRENIFLLSVPNGAEYHGEADSVTFGAAAGLLESCADAFQYLIVDGSADTCNPVSTMALVLSRHILCLHRPSVTAALWWRSLRFLRDGLFIDPYITHIQYADNNDCAGFADTVSVRMAAAVPHVRGAPLYENTGTPLYFQSRDHQKALDGIAARLIRGEALA